MPNTTRRPANYIEPAELAALVRDYRRTGRVSEQLGRALLAIVGGVWDRYRFTPERDEFCADAVLHLMGRPLGNCDPRQNGFSYLTTSAIRFGLKLRDRAACDRRRFERYAADLVAEGDQIPEAE